MAVYPSFALKGIPEDPLEQQGNDAPPVEVGGDNPPQPGEGGEGGQENPALAEGERTTNLTS